MRRALITCFAVASLAAWTLTACGGGDLSPEEQAVADTYTTYINAVKRGDGEKACSLLTPAFQRRAAATIAIGSRSKLKNASCPEAIRRGRLPQLQQFVPNLEQIVVNGQRASGTDPGEGLIGPQKVFFRRLGGDWKISKTIFAKSQPG
jgi:hypothetical protein